MTARAAARTRPTPAADLVRAAAADLVHLAPDPHAWRDAAIVATVDAALAAGDAAAVTAVADGFGRLLTRVPAVSGDEVVLQPAGIAERRRRGAFATPPALAAQLAAHALPAPVASVVDPACGPGALLLAAFDRLLALGVAPGTAARALHGVDADPAAVAVCRAALAVAARAQGADEDAVGGLATRIVVGDALLGPTPLRPGEGLAWHSAFPGVLDVPGAPAEPVTGWRGGFGAVLANPPWERLKVTRKDWAGAPPPGLRADRAAGARSLRDAGRHPLTGAGELNAYLPFVETCWRLLAPDGRAGVLAPAGIASDRSSSALLAALLDAGALDALLLLDPPEAVFDAVSRRVGVAVVVLRRGPHAGSDPGAPPATVAVGVPDAAPPEPGRAWPLDAATLRLVNPNSSTAPLFGSPADAAIVTGVHRRCPVLVRRTPDGADSPWRLRLVTPLHMTRDARWFATAPGPGLLPLFEAKHAGLLDHRGGGRAQFRYWVPRTLVDDRFGELAGRGWLAGYRNVTTSDSPRTLVPTPLPVAGVGNSLPLVSAPRLPLLLAALASLPVDYLARQRHAGANLNFFKLEQVPVPPPEAYDVVAPWSGGGTVAAWVLDRFAAAVGAHDDLAGLTAELAGDGIAVPPADAARRAAALADLDAAHAVLLGLSRADLAHVLTTFGALRRREERTAGRFGTAERVLAAYDRLA